MSASPKRVRAVFLVFLLLGHEVAQCKRTIDGEMLVHGHVEGDQEDLGIEAPSNQERDTTGSSGTADGPMQLARSQMPESSTGDSGMLREIAVATYSSNSSMVMVAGQQAELESKEGVVVLAIVALVLTVIGLCIGIGSLIQGIISMVSKRATKRDVNARKARLKGVLETLATSARVWAKQVDLFRGQMETVCASKECDANAGSIEATSQYQHALSTFQEFKNRLQQAYDTVEKAKADFALGPPETPYNGSAWFNKKWKDSFVEDDGQKSYLWFKGRGIKDDVFRQMSRRYGYNTAGMASGAVQHIHEVFGSKEKSMTITEDFALEYNGWLKQGVCCVRGSQCYWCPCDSGYDGGCGTTGRCLACEEGAASDAIFGWSEIKNHAEKAVSDVDRAQRNLYQMFQTTTIAFNTWQAIL